MTTDRKRGYLYILLAAMLYSTTEVALKALGGAFAPMQVTVERVLLGAAALMPFALNDLKKRDIQLTKADWGYFTLLGFLTGPRSAARTRRSSSSASRSQATKISSDA